MKQEILDKVEECIKIAELHYNASIPRPKNFNFKRKGTTAGWCKYFKSELMFQLDLAEANPDDFLKTLVPHEVAHWVQRWKYPCSKPHGKEWQGIMRHIYKLEPDRCHNYDTSVTTTKKKQATYTYKCKCRTFQLTQTRHNKIKKGIRYRCQNCNTHLIYADLSEKELQIERIKKELQNLQ